MSIIKVENNQTSLGKININLVILSTFIFPTVYLYVSPGSWRAWSAVLVFNIAMILCGFVRVNFDKQRNKIVALAIIVLLYILTQTILNKQYFIESIGAFFYIAWIIGIFANNHERTITSFIYIAIAHATVSCAVLITIENIDIQTLACLVLFTFVILTLHLSITHHKAFPDVRSSPSQKVGYSYKWLIPITIFILIIAIPFALIKQYIQDVENFPSIGALPPITASNKVAFVAKFEDDSPKIPYWQQSYSYDRYIGIGIWALGHDDNDLILTKEHSATDNSYTYSYINKPKNEPYHLTGLYDISVDGDNFVYTAYKNYTKAKHEVLGSYYQNLYLSIPAIDQKVAKSKNETNKIFIEENMTKTLSMVRQWRSEGLNDQEIIDKTLNYFKDNLAYNYDHQYSDPEKNQLDWFLFEDKKGVCRHFSNAFALMMRMAGIPSRIRGGFAGGDFNEQTNTWTIRGKDAHAWTEVWLEGQGWVLIDPTSYVPVEKGIPKGKMDLASLFGIESGVTLKNSFSTAASLSRNVGGKVENIIINSFNKFKDINFAWVLLIPTLFLMYIVKRKILASRDIKPAQIKAWERLMVILEKKGAIISQHEGPRDLGDRLSNMWPEDYKDEWLALVKDFEEYKFGRKEKPDLVFSLKLWQKKAKYFNIK